MRKSIVVSYSVLIATTFVKFFLMSNRVGTSSFYFRVSRLSAVFFSLIKFLIPSAVSLI